MKQVNETIKAMAVEDREESVRRGKKESKRANEMESRKSVFKKRKNVNAG
jgi:hypothetical protein